MQAEIAEQAAKAAPPVAVAGVSIAGIPLSEWVYALTAVYLLFQIVVIIPRVCGVFKKEK